jgi:hypothetical protein
MKSGIAKPINYNVREITQEEKENPVLFYDRLQEDFRKCTNMNLSSREGAALLNQHFVTQSAPDTRQKLQKLQLRLQTNKTQLLDSTSSKG